MDIEEHLQYWQPGVETAMERQPEILSGSEFRAPGEFSITAVSLYFDRPQPNPHPLPNGDYFYLPGDRTVIRTKVEGTKGAAQRIQVRLFLDGNQIATWPADISEASFEDETWINSFHHHIDWGTSEPPALREFTAEAYPQSASGGQVRSVPKGVRIVIGAEHVTGFLADPDPDSPPGDGSKFAATGSGGGYPWQGYGGGKLGGGHWTNRDPWYVGEAVPGFYNVCDEDGAPRINVHLQSGYDERGNFWELKNAWWFHFRVRIPADNTQTRFPFRLVMNHLGRPSWNITSWGAYDFNVFRPVYRVLSEDELGEDAGDNAINYALRWGRTAPGQAEGVSQFTFEIDLDPESRDPGKIYYLEVAQTFPFPLGMVDWLNGTAGAMLPYRPDPSVTYHSLVLDGGAEPWEFSDLDGEGAEVGDNVAGLGYNRIKPLLLWKRIGAGVPAPPVILLTAVHLEPTVQWMMAAMIARILESPSLYLDRASYLFVPVMNPDGQQWGITEVSPVTAQDPHDWYSRSNKTREGTIAELTELGDHLLTQIQWLLPPY